MNYTQQELDRARKIVAEENKRQADIKALQENIDLLARLKNSMSPDVVDLSISVHPNGEHLGELFTFDCRSDSRYGSIMKIALNELWKQSIKDKMDYKPEN